MSEEDTYIKWRKTKEEVVNYSNKLSEQHYALKVEMLKAVG